MHVHLNGEVRTVRMRSTWVGIDDDSIYARRGSGSGFKSNRPPDDEDLVLK